MTGNVSPSGVVLGTSTVAGSAIALLPNTGSNSIFKYFLIAIIVVAAVVLVTRATKLIVTRVNR